MVPQGDASFPKQVALLFPAAVFRADASMNRSILSSDSIVSTSGAGWALASSAGTHRSPGRR